MAKLIVISWRDIPAQVIAKRGRESARAQLAQRFQAAVDRAAMRAGKGSSDAYLADWKRSVPRECGDDLAAEATAEAVRLEARYTDADLLRLIRAKGVDENQAEEASAGRSSSDMVPDENPAANALTGRGTDPAAGASPAEDGTTGRGPDPTQEKESA